MLMERFSNSDKNSIVEMVSTSPQQFLIDEWKLGKLLGSGSFSQVYFMTPRSIGLIGRRKKKHDAETNFVGKFINVRSAVTNEAFIQEAQLLHVASGTSKHIVDIVGIVMQPQVIIMKYYRNGSLDHALLGDFKSFRVGEAGEFPITRRLKFIHELCLAVYHLHVIGIVHRDIASRNILLSDDRDRIVLADFGLARKMNIDEPNDKNLTGTTVIPVTSPPET
jgi:serine/threonine protein kinase